MEIKNVILKLTKWGLKPPFYLIIGIFMPFSFAQFPQCFAEWKIILS